MVTVSASIDQDALDRGRQALLRGWSTTVTREANLLLVRAKGTRIWDAGGNEYIDCTSQAWSNNIGAGHPNVLAAAAAQAEEIAHARSNYDTIPLLLFSDRITQLAPRGLNRVGHCLHGSLAVEMALKIAAKNRPGAANPLTLYDGYHGRSLATMSASWPHTHDEFHRLQPQFVRVPQPYPYRAPAGMSGDDIAVHYADLLRDTIRRGVNGRPSALLMEPIQGNGGHVEYPSLYYKLVRQICDEEGLLLIWDEIQTGLGRLGAWWASDLYDVVPDILVFGKSVAGGYPLAGVLVREDLAGFETGDDALTFGQFPVSLAAGLATLDVLENEGLIDAARDSGTYLTSRLREMQDRHPLMGDVRCPGLFTAVELVKDRETKEPATKEAEEVYDRGLKHGVMFGTSRYAGLGNVVKIKPPLTINRADMDQVIDVFDRVLSEIEGSSR